MVARPINTMASVAEEEGFDIRFWRESLRRRCYDKEDLSVAHSVAEEFVDMVRALSYLDSNSGQGRAESRFLASTSW